MSEAPKSPALDPATVAAKVGTDYPEVFKQGVEARRKRILGDPLGLSRFGVNLTRLGPGVMSAQRHFHSHEDEFIMVVEGELILITDGGEQVLGAGTVAGFAAGTADGHHLVNRTGADAVYLEVGSRHPDDEVDYPDIDMRRENVDGKRTFVRRDGTAY